MNINVTAILRNARPITAEFYKTLHANPDPSEFATLIDEVASAVETWDRRSDNSLVRVFLHIDDGLSDNSFSYEFSTPAVLRAFFEAGAHEDPPGDGGEPVPVRYWDVDYSPWMDETEDLK